MRDVAKATAVSNRKARARARPAELTEEQIRQMGSKAVLIQELIPLGLKEIERQLQEEVTFLAGMRYKHAAGGRAFTRWGGQERSVYIMDQKVPIRVQRVRDVRYNTEAGLRTLEAFREPKVMDDLLYRRILYGLSCRDYKACAGLVANGFGLSASNVSKRFIEASEQKLKELMGRRLDGYDIVALVIDGKGFGDDGIMTAVGVDTLGRKIMVGVIETATENATVCAEFLEGLIERGLRIEDGLLVVIDGSKGLTKAVKGVFGEKALIQRCQWHKRENVVSYLPKREQAEVRHDLQRAYEQTTYAAAKQELLHIHKELLLRNKSAAASLMEGLEETLTLHRLGLFAEVGLSLKTTNVCESIQALVERRTGKVCYWRNSSQKLRWIASALLDIEPRLNRIKGYRYLWKLKEVLKNMTCETMGEALKEAA